MIGEFFYGIRTLLRGFGTWRRRPGLMALGLVPGLIAALVLLAGLVPLALSLAPISDAVTPFADGWIPAWRSVFRAAVGIVIFAAALALASAVFSALALTIGDPFYQRIWRAVEADLGDAPPSDGGGFWMAVGEGLRLVVLGILIAILVLLLGLVPLVGGVSGRSEVSCCRGGCSHANSPGEPSTPANSPPPTVPCCSAAVARGCSASVSRRSSAS